jgi:hypothetical protein
MYRPIFVRTRHFNQPAGGSRKNEETTTYNLDVKARR